MSKKYTVGQLKAWALANYTKGADTFVECWSDSDYQRLIDEEAKPLAALKRLASIYRERQADARHYREVQS